MSSSLYALEKELVLPEITVHEYTVHAGPKRVLTLNCSDNGRIRILLDDPIVDDIGKDLFSLIDPMSLNYRDSAYCQSFNGFENITSKLLAKYAVFSQKLQELREQRLCLIDINNQISGILDLHDIKNSFTYYGSVDDFLSAN